MKITCLGGGPGGLYLALLVKALDPRHEVTVLERNGPDDTFGWGVVFSDETLAGLEAADPCSSAEINQHFERWQDIQTTFKGQTLRSGGHGFAGLSRRTLLGILQRRCAQVGVDVRHHVEVDPAAGLPAADLVVAADGVNSRTRSHFADRFEPTVTPGRSPFIWLGTPKAFDAFTFLVRENADGIFQVHAYRFEEGLSTFIVETDEASWLKAGLDRATTEESVAYCERLFAEDLEGAPLLTNKSAWIRFQTVKCRHWSSGNVVLLGDAAHTAHYSIGSGTKIAMEDAIALAEALRLESSVPAALAAYETARRPVVERTQAVASHSQTWFEELPRHARLEPEPFVFSLLTRSKRLGRANLKERDPAYIERVDRWTARSQGVTSEPAPPPIALLLRLGHLTLQNRVVVSPMCQYSAQDGLPDDWHLVHLGSRAVGGAGLVLAEMTDVAPDGRISPGCAGLWSEAHAAAWRRVVDFVHAHSQAAIGVQLAHAGRKGSTGTPWEGGDRPLAKGGWDVIAPSALAFGPGSPRPRAMDQRDLDRVRDEFVRATALAAEAGFDVAELHAAHGYLLGSFLSPLSNQRDDRYGGSLDNCLRYPLEVCRAVRAAWPRERPLGVRISATDWVAGGLDAADAVRVAAAFGAAGCDFIDVSTGGTTPESHPEFYGRMYQVAFAERIRSETGLLTATVGNITTADQANTIIAAGRADLVVLARQHLRDPYFTLHAAEESGYAGGGAPWPRQYRAVDPGLTPGAPHVELSTAQAAARAADWTPSWPRHDSWWGRGRQ